MRWILFRIQKDNMDISYYKTHRLRLIFLVDWIGYLIILGITLLMILNSTNFLLN